MGINTTVIPPLAKRYSSTNWISIYFCFTLSSRDSIRNLSLSIRYVVKPKVSLEQDHTIHRPTCKHKKEWERETETQGFTYTSHLCRDSSVKEQEQKVKPNVSLHSQ